MSHTESIGSYWNGLHPECFASEIHLNEGKAASVGLTAATNICAFNWSEYKTSFKNRGKNIGVTLGDVHVVFMDKSNKSFCLVFYFAQENEAQTPITSCDLILKKSLIQQSFHCQSLVFVGEPTKVES